MRYGHWIAGLARKEARRDRSGWRWSLREVEAEQDGETLRVQGQSLPDGRVQLELAGAGRNVKLAGPILSGSWDVLR